MKLLPKLPQKIKNAPDTETAFELAMHGYLRTPVEIAVHTYMHWHDAQHKAKNSKSKYLSEIEFLNKAEAESSEALAEIIFTAIDSRDTKTIHEIADYVKTYPQTGCIDRMRCLILSLKEILNKDGRKMSIADLANRLANCKMYFFTLSNKKDGHAYLRRVAKELKFPIAD